jgi:hypothetical protein
VRILVPDQIERRVTIALENAGNQEIGGILMGEHVADAVYRLRDLTIQRHGGTWTSFVRAIRAILSPLRRFFHATGYNFTRFNYLGEWHSHPSFSLQPSELDHQTMWEILGDPQVGANFVVLIIVRLSSAGHLEGAATVYIPGHQVFAAELIRDEAM